MVPLSLAVHISDGILRDAWVYGGILLASFLALAASYRVRDEEIPRIALLSAAFFVVSGFINVPFGPTHVHLLLNGLVGVLLGRRAGLAIPLALFLQAALLQHGGMWALGVNSCVMTLPALLAAGLFALVVRLPVRHHPWFGAALVAASVLAWVLFGAFAVALLRAVPAAELTAEDFEAAARVALHPATVAAAVALALPAAWAERRAGNAPEFAWGLLLGVLTVLLTTALNAAALVWGGSEKWHAVALAVFVAHLPLAALEGVVLGFAVAFLARVKPELLGIPAPTPERPWPASAPAPHLAAVGEGVPAAPVTTGPPSRGPLPPALLIAALAGLLFASPAYAHRLEAEYRVLPGRWVQVEAWFDLTGDSPRGASVQVFRPDGSPLTEGQLNEKGLYLFRAEQPEALRVVVSAGAGHRAEFTVPAKALSGEAAPSADRSHPGIARDVIIGVGFFLAAAAFVLSARNARRIRELTRGSDGPPPD
jgi:cobalt/nickel transport system permease protein